MQMRSLGVAALALGLALQPASAQNAGGSGLNVPVANAGGGSGSGTVTSVGATFTGGLINIGGSPVTSSGTFALTVAGTNGGIPYFSSTSGWGSSALLAANQLMTGGGAGSAPSTIATGSGVVTALGNTAGAAGGFAIYNQLGSAALLGVGTGLSSSGGNIVLGDSVGISYTSPGQLTLGTAGSAAGKVIFDNATSGTIALQPTTGALGSSVATLPANSGTLGELNLAQSWTAAQTYSDIEFVTGTGATHGFSTTGTGDISLYESGTRYWAFDNATLYALGTNPSLQLLSNTANMYFGAGSDTELTRVSAGLFAMNGGLAMTGTKPTLTTGSCSGSSAVGGATAGSFTAASCSAGTYILSGLPTATNGYACDAQDRTMPADILTQTASGTTSATFTATTAASDAIQFKCLAY